METSYLSSLSTTTEVNTLANSLGVNLSLDPKDFLRSLGNLSGYSLSNSQIENVFNKYDFVPTNECIKVIKKERKTNRNRRLELLNLNEEVNYEPSFFSDATGLRKQTVAEKMNKEAFEPLHPLGYGSANPLFFNNAEDALVAMENQLAMAAALVHSLNLNLQRAKQLVALQKSVSSLENKYTVPMTGSLRSIMNQSKMKLETFTIASSSWCSGMYLPKLSMCLMTAMYRPQARSVCQSLLVKLDEALQEGKEPDVNEFDEIEKNIFMEIRRSGLAAALSKQMRGRFTSYQKREDHQHSIFVTASLREQLYFFISTAPMQICRRMNLQQFPLSRVLVAAERFIDTDVNGTVDGFRQGNFSIGAFLPPSTFDGPLIFNQEQFDGGGSINLINCKTIRPEVTGVGVKEAEFAIANGTSDHLKSLAIDELNKANSCKVQLNVTNEFRTNEIRAENREQSSHRDLPTETTDFIRQGPYIYMAESAPIHVTRNLLPTDNKISPYSSVHAINIPGNVITPKFSSNTHISSIDELNQFTLQQQEHVSTENILFSNDISVINQYFLQKTPEIVSLPTEKPVDETAPVDEAPREQAPTEEVTPAEEPTEKTVEEISTEERVTSPQALQLFSAFISSVQTVEAPKRKRLSEDLGLDGDGDSTKRTCVIRKKTRDERRLEKILKQTPEDKLYCTGIIPTLPKKFSADDNELPKTVSFNIQEIAELNSAVQTTTLSSLPSSLPTSFMKNTEINGALLTFFQSNTKGKSREELLSSFVHNCILDNETFDFDENTLEN